jgi:capsule polysaccharide export protein KpsE/RkpR
MVIWRLCDESLATYGHPYLGLLYHEMVFNSWRQRALRRDPAFVLAEVVKKVDEQVMQSAKARLTTVLHGLGGPEPKESRVAPAEAAAGGQSELIAKQQAALSKLEAQMQAVQKRATPGPPAPQKLVNALSKQESSYGDGLTSRQRSTQKWIDKMKGRGR